MDPAPPTPELVVTTLGIEKFLDASARTWRYVLDDAARLPKKVSDLMRRYLTSADHDEPEDLPPFDFKAVKKLLLGSGSIGQSDAIHAGIGDPTLARGAVDVASRIIEYLKPLMPKSERATAAGPVPVQPSAQDLAAFRRVYQVADDPLLVLRDLNEGCLSRGQVRSFQQLYPQLYGLLGDVVPEVLANIKSGRGANWQLPRRKEQGLKLLLGQDTSSPLQLAQYQKGYQQKQEQQGGPTPGARPDTDKLLTPGQRHA
jgi:hypothetical protein